METLNKLFFAVQLLLVALTAAGGLTTDGLARPRSVPLPDEPRADKPVSGATGRAAIDQGVPPENAAVRVHYTLQKAGQISVGVYDKDGRLVRTLLRGKYQPPGDHRLGWDGLGSLGRAVEPGKYIWKLLRIPGFTVQYLATLGTNPGSKPYDFWIGNHAGPRGVTVHGDAMYVASGTAENVPALIKQSLDGKKRFWAHHGYGPWQGAIALGVGGKDKLYLLQQNGKIKTIDPETGRQVASWDVLHEKTKVKEKRQFIYNRHKVDMAARGTTIVVSYSRQNEVRWLDPKDGSIAKRLTIDSPRGLALDSDEAVYVACDSQVFRVEDGGAKQSVVTGLKSPFRIAYDIANDHLLIAEKEPGNQVKRYNLEGKQLQRYGREGGRKGGQYNPRDFRNVTDLTADGEGGFFVAEDWVPRRVAHFGKNGRVLKEWYGGVEFYASVAPDPRDPALVWYNNYGRIVLARMNFAGGTWNVLEAYEYTGGEDPSDPKTWTHQVSHQFYVRYHDGTRYLLSDGQFQVFEHTDGHLRAVALSLGGKNQTERLKKFAGKSRGFWSDLNHDGEVQKSEIADPIHRSDGGRIGGRIRIGHGFTIVSVWGVPASDDISKALGREYGVNSKTVAYSGDPIWRNGVPLYSKMHKGGEALFDVGMASGGGHSPPSAYSDKEGNVYALARYTGDSHGRWWVTGRIGPVNLHKWRKDGALEWTAAQHAINYVWRGKGAPPGHFHEPKAILSVLKDTVVTAERWGTPAKVWTTDGLYAGTFLDRRAADGLPKAAYTFFGGERGADPDRGKNGWVVEPSIIASDNGTGGAVMETDEGEIIWYTPGRNCFQVYRVNGWDEMNRQTGTVELKKRIPGAKQKGKGLRATYFDNPNLQEPKKKTLDDMMNPASGEDEKGKTAMQGAGGKEFKQGPVTRIDRQLWFDQYKPYAHHRPGDAPYYWWNEETKVGRVAGGWAPSEGFSVRWVGQLEAPLSERYVFSVYLPHQGSGVRMKVAGKDIIDAWRIRGKKIAKGKLFGPYTLRGVGKFPGPKAYEVDSAPIVLEAGKRYPVVVEFRNSKLKQPFFSLNWESFTLERRRVQARYLYPPPRK
ncbi:MAG: FlgD immunoglobulin-like domain containing protein [Candidatus Brocadiia bacterium]